VDVVGLAAPDAVREPALPEEEPLDDTLGLLVGLRVGLLRGLLLGLLRGVLVGSPDAVPRVSSNMPWESA
jgi:hypothetical protein